MGIYHQRSRRHHRHHHHHHHHHLLLLLLLLLLLIIIIIIIIIIHGELGLKNLQLLSICFPFPPALILFSIFRLLVLPLRHLLKWVLAQTSDKRRTCVLSLFFSLRWWWWWCCCCCCWWWWWWWWLSRCMTSWRRRTRGNVRWLQWKMENWSRWSQGRW